MTKQSSKNFFEWYSEVALQKLKEMPQYETFKDCKTRKEFQEYMLNVFIAHYGLRCTCDDIQDWEFNKAYGHYHSCDLWKFCHIVERCLDWAEHQNKKSENLK